MQIQKGLAREATEEHLKRKGEESLLGGRFWNKPGDQDCQEITLISANNINELLLYFGLTHYRMNFFSVEVTFSLYMN